MRGGKNGIYRNLLESINDIVPKIPLVTLMLPVCCDSKGVKRDVKRC